MDQLFAAFGEAITNVLPLSPFREWIDKIGELEYLSWLNWFFPVGDCLKVMAVWLGAITLFYIYSIVMRWLKVID